MMQLTNFSSGLYSPLFFDAQIPTTALLQANNVHYNAAGHLSARRGRTLYATLPSQVTSQWRHYPRTGNPATLAASDSGTNVTIRHDTASNGTFAAPTGAPTLATGKRVRWCNWPSKDRSFFTNGDGLWSYNGVITQVTTAPIAVTGPYLVVHQSRLYITKSDEVNFSVYSSDVNDETVVSGSNQLNVSDPQGGSITGLFSLPDRLVVLKSTSIWTSLGDIKYGAILTKLCETGCIAPNSTAQAPYGIFFVARDGVYLTDGQSPQAQKLSEPINWYFRWPDQNWTYGNAVGVYYPRLDAYVVKLSPAHAYCLVLQRVPQAGGKPSWAWSLHTPLSLLSAVAWDSEGDTGDWYAADTTGHIYHMDNGTTDDGTPYQMSFQTGAIRFGPVQQPGRVHYVYCNYHGTAPVSVGLRYNNTDTDDVSLSLGATQALGLQRARKMVTDHSKSGQYVSVAVTMPQDAYNAEFYTLRLDARLRARRTWR